MNKREVNFKEVSDLDDDDFMSQTPLLRIGLSLRRTACTFSNSYNHIERSLLLSTISLVQSFFEPHRHNRNRGNIRIGTSTIKLLCEILCSIPGACPDKGRVVQLFSPSDKELFKFGNDTCTMLKRITERKSE